MSRLVKLLAALSLLSAGTAFAQSNCDFRHNPPYNDGCIRVDIFDQGITWANYPVWLCAGKDNYCSNPIEIVYSNASDGAYFQPGAGQWYTIFPHNSPCYIDWMAIYNELDYVWFNYNGTGDSWGFKNENLTGDIVPHNCTVFD